MIWVVTWFLALEDFNLLNYKETNFLNNLELLHSICSTSGFWKIKGDARVLAVECSLRTVASLCRFLLETMLVSFLYWYGDVLQEFTSNAYNTWTQSNKWHWSCPQNRERFCIVAYKVEGKKMAQIQSSSIHRLLECLKWCKTHISVHFGVYGLGTYCVQDQHHGNILASTISYSLSLESRLNLS